MRLGSLAEALEATIHVPTHLRSEFLVIGGTVLRLLGLGRATEDADIAASEAAHSAFMNSIEKDSCYKELIP
jgi:hypothetical protein